jgi:hypothetical protein
MKLAPGPHSVTGGRSIPEASATVDVLPGENRQLVLRTVNDTPASELSLGQPESRVQR